MATEATVTIDPEAFPLGTIFEEAPGVTVELERIVPAADAIIPYFWVRGMHVEDIQAAFRDHVGVRDIELVDSVEDEYLLRVEWDPSYEGILAALADAQVPITSAVGTNEQWTFEIRGDEREDITTFTRRCQELDVPITVTAIHALTPVETETESALTDPQQEALILAYERGYFNSPRDVTMEELGEELGISQQAVASRLRRGMRGVLGQTIPALEA